MQMKKLTPEQLKQIYRRDLTVAFPPEELKPLRAMERLQADGTYCAWGLMDGEEIVGMASVFRVAPGWSLFDYLCVTPARRGDGLGADLVSRLADLERGNVLFGESEVPQYAPDPELARRRLAFYQRNGAKLAGYDIALFGVPYRVLYWAERDVAPEELAKRHAQAYQSRFTPKLYHTYVKIPWTIEDGVPARMDWAHLKEDIR